MKSLILAAVAAVCLLGSGCKKETIEKTQHDIAIEHLESRGYTMIRFTNATPKCDGSMQNRLTFFSRSAQKSGSICWNTSSDVVVSLD